MISSRRPLSAQAHASLLAPTRAGPAGFAGADAESSGPYARLNLRTPGMEFASEMVVKACLQQQKITEVPIVLHPDGRGRPPHLRSFHDGWRHLRFLLLLCPMCLYIWTHDK
jgi:hypothetical protein